jgi:ABC-type glycerol-3-phosphate transport system substrate-binding protein
MKFTLRWLIVAVAAVCLAGCAGTSSASDNQPGALTTHGDSDNPPPTVSGYVDTSYTGQVR